MTELGSATGEASQGRLLPGKQDPGESASSPRGRELTPPRRRRTAPPFAPLHRSFPPPGTHRRYRRNSRLLPWVGRPPERPIPGIVTWGGGGSGDWMTSLGTVPRRFNHAVAFHGTPTLFGAVYYSTADCYAPPPLLPHSSADMPLACSHTLLIISSAPRGGGRGGAYVLRS